MLLIDIATPVISFFKVLKLLFIFLYEIVSPVFIFALEVIKLKVSFLKLIFYMPAMSLLKVFLLVRDCFVATYIFVKEIVQLLATVKRILLPAAKSVSENREATYNIISFFQQLGSAWS